MKEKANWSSSSVAAQNRAPKSGQGDYCAVSWRRCPTLGWSGNRPRWKAAMLMIIGPASRRANQTRGSDACGDSGWDCAPARAAPMPGSTARSGYAQGTELIGAGRRIQGRRPRAWW